MRLRKCSLRGTELSLHESGKGSGEIWRRHAAAEGRDSSRCAVVHHIKFQRRRCVPMSDTAQTIRPATLKVGAHQPGRAR